MTVKDKAISSHMATLSQLHSLLFRTFVASFIHVILHVFKLQLYTIRSAASLGARGANCLQFLTLLTALLYIYEPYSEAYTTQLIEQVL